MSQIFPDSVTVNFLYRRILYNLPEKKNYKLTLIFLRLSVYEFFQNRVNIFNSPGFELKKGLPGKLNLCTTKKDKDENNELIFRCRE